MDIAPIQRYSYTQKSASNFKWVEEVADYYDFYHGGADSDLLKKHDKYKLNYDLANGRADVTEAYRDIVSFYLKEEKIDLGLNNVHHYPIINQIIQGMTGQWIKRPLEPRVYDASSHGVTQRKREQVKLIQNYLQDNLISPEIERITQSYFQENGIEDPYSLTIEEQQAAQQEIDQRITEGLKQIDEYMKKEYRSPSSVQAQKLMNYLMKELRIKETCDMNFEHYLIAGEAYFYTGIRHNRPTFEKVNPMWFTWGGSQNTEFAEDGEFCKYTQYLKISDFFNRYGDVLTPNQVKKVHELISVKNGSGYNFDSGEFRNQVILEIDTDYGGIENMTPDFKTRRGQQDIASIYTKAAEKLGIPRSEFDTATIRETHITFRSLRKLYSVKRIVNGNIKHYYRDEHYEFDPLKGDIEAREIWVPEIWECRKFGAKEGIYIDKRPLPYQYRSLNNPYDVKHPYVGQKLNNLSGNSENVSIVDLGKVWNLDFDIMQARLKEKMATDVGKIFLMVTDMIPEGYTVGQWLQAVKYGKIAPIQLTEGLAAGVTPQMLKEIDLSQVMELDKMMNTLQYYQTQTAISMYYNPSMLGQISPYITSSNNQQNIQQSSNQTEKIFSTYTNIIERALNNLLKAARIAYKESDEVLRWVLDDGSIAELELDSEMLDRSEMGLFITNDYADIQATEFIKQNVLALMQNQYPTSSIIKLSGAKSTSEMLAIAEAQEARAEEAKQQDYQMQMQQQQQASAAQQQLIDSQNQVKILMQEKDLNTKLQGITLDREKFALAQDLDRDGVNDANQRKEDELEAKKEIEQMKMTEARRTKELELKIKEKELQLKEKELELREKEIAIAAKEAAKPASKG